MPMRCLPSRSSSPVSGSAPGTRPRSAVDVLTWSRPDGVEELTAKAPNLPIVAKMHSLIGEVLAVDTGEIAHSRMPLPASTMTPGCRPRTGRWMSWPSACQGRLKTDPLSTVEN